MALTTKLAYRKGWDASARTTTYDMDAAEDRFHARYGTAFSDAFTAGWTDHASGYEFGDSYADRF